MAVAVLHDYLEDGGIEEELRFTIPSSAFATVLSGIKTLTRDRGERYHDYIMRIKGSGWEKIKIADLEHNMDLGRLKQVMAKDWERYIKYVKAREILLDKE